MKHWAKVLALMSMCASAIATPLLAQGGTIGGGGGAPTSLTALINGSAASPSIAWANSTGLGLYRFGSDTLGIATVGGASLFVSGGTNAKFGNAAGNTWDLVSGANAKLRITSTGIQSIDTLVLSAGVMRGGAGNLTIQAGTGNDRSLLLAVTNGSASNVTNLSLTSALASFNSGIRLRVNEDGTAASPAVHFGNSTGTGFSLIDNGSTDTLVTSTNGARSLALIGGASPTLIGGAGNMTIKAGTGNSRTMTLQATNGSGTATTFAQGAGDTLKLAGHLIATGLTSEGSTQSAVCVTNGGGEVFINAAATCTVSSARFKKNIGTLRYLEALGITNKLHPTEFTYRENNVAAIGLIAEEAYAVDARLARRDEQGRVNSVNYEQVTIALLAVVQKQQARLDAMCRAGIRSAC